MSTDFTVPLHSHLSDSNDYTNQIHNVFNQYWTILNKERQTTIEKINDWRLEWRKRINEYANEQKDLINDHYNCLRSTFDEKYRENLETANVYHAAQKVTLFNELHEACQSLTFSIAMLQFAKDEMERPQVISVEKQLETKSSEAKDDARRRRRRGKENSNKTENIHDTSASSPPDLVASNSKETDDGQSSKAKPNRKNDQSTANIDDSQNQISKDQSDNKCPICFMIFPLSMTNDHRRQHVNEHYTDD